MTEILFTLVFFFVKVIAFIALSIFVGAKGGQVIGRIAALFTAGIIRSMGLAGMIVIGIPVFFVSVMAMVAVVGPICALVIGLVF